MRGGRRGGRPFRGGGSGHFGSRPDGSGLTFPGKGRGGGRGRHFSAPGDKAIAFVQGESSQSPGGPPQHLMPLPYASGGGQAPFAVPAHAQNSPVWPPARMAWCELCRVDCTTPEILEQHKNGKRHKKNLQVHEELQKINKMLVGGQNEQVPVPEVKHEVPIRVEGSEDKSPQENLSSQTVVNKNEVETHQQKVSGEQESTEEPARKLGMDHSEGRGCGLKRKMRGGRGGKWIRTREGLRRPIAPPKPKQIVPLFCDLCNVKCDSQVVFESHLSGKKHLGNLKRFQGHQIMLGQAALQALYPALQALYPALQALYNPSPDSSTSFAPQDHQGSEGPPPQLKPSVILTGQAEGASETGSYNAVTVDGKSLMQPMSEERESETGSATKTVSENETLEVDNNEIKVVADASGAELSRDMGSGAEQALSRVDTGNATAIPDSGNHSSDGVCPSEMDKKSDWAESQSNG